MCIVIVNVVVLYCILSTELSYRAARARVGGQAEAPRWVAPRTVQVALGLVLWPQDKDIARLQQMAAAPGEGAVRVLAPVASAGLICANVAAPSTR